MIRREDIFIIAITLLSNDVTAFSMEMNAVVSPPAQQTRIVVDEPADLSLQASHSRRGVY